MGLGQWSQYLHSVRVDPLGICPDLWTQKSVWPEKFNFARETNRRASTRVWRGRSVDLGQPRDYQLNVGEGMRSEWLDLQTQVRKFQKKSDLEKSKFDEGS